MLRRIAITAITVLATPTLAMAQGYEEHHPPGRPSPDPFQGGPAGRYMYHGRPFNPIHAGPFVYPRG
jgi:hypothetical protein